MSVVIVNHRSEIWTMYVSGSTIVHEEMVAKTRCGSCRGISECYPLVLTHPPIHVHNSFLLYKHLTAAIAKVVALKKREYGSREGRFLLA